MTRVGFAGTSSWAAEALTRLAGSPGLEVACALTQPDRPAGRGRQVARPPVAEAAEHLGIAVLQPDRPVDALPALQEAGCEAMALVAYGALVPRPLLDALPWLNVHPSLLPRYRGAAPIERALMAGDDELGVAVMLLVEALDAGPVASLERFAVDLDDVAGDAYARALELGIPALARALPDAAAGSLATVPQVGEPTYAAKLSPADRLLHVERPAREVHDHVRALSPHIGARLALDGELFVVWRTRLLGDAPPAPPGSLREEAGRLLLACGTGAVEMVDLQPPGRRRLDAASWLRGHRGPLPTVTLA